MIYVVEDDRGIRELVSYALSQSGYESECFSSAKDFYAALCPEKAALVILDIMLPGEGGLSILSRLRARPETAHIPVMMMSALGEERDKVKGLDLGADDYVAKPFGMMEFLARVRAQLRRRGGQDGLSASGITVYPSSRRVETESGDVSLTVREFELLEYLLRRAGAVVRREELLGAVWGYTGGEETRTLDVHIRSLRAKLGASGEAIKTVRGVGYMVEK